MNAIPSRRSDRFRTHAPTWLTVALLAAAAGCASGKKADPASLRAEIDAANKRFMETFARADGSALSEMYTEDAQLLPPGSQAIEGRAGIETLWTGLFALPVKEIQLETRDLFGHGDDACEVGRYRLVGNDGSIFEAGKYTVIWRRQEGGWKLHRDMWNTDVPAPAVSATAPADSAR